MEQRVQGKENELVVAEREVEREQAISSSSQATRPKRAFVVMPFSPEFNDIYILGIREVAEQLGMIVERADSIEHNQSIPDVIRNRIELCDVVIADTSKGNPNVFYEVGLANGMQKETILICGDVQTIPFDLSSINHITYASIVELRDKLKARLKATLGL